MESSIALVPFPFFLYCDHCLSQGALVGLVITTRVVRKGVSVVLIHDLAFGYRLLHGFFMVASRW